MPIRANNWEIETYKYKNIKKHITVKQFIFTQKIL